MPEDFEILPKSLKDIHFHVLIDLIRNLYFPACLCWPLCLILKNSDTLGEI